MSKKETQVSEVLVIGNGPVGTVAALRLAQHGIRVTLIDKIAVAAQDLRASTFHAPTIEMLDSIGLAEPLLERGLKAPIYQFRDRRTGEIFALDMGELADRTRFPFRLQCEQYKLVTVADAMLSAMENVTVRREAELIGIAQDAGGVIAKVRTADGEETLTAPFAIAADGASSFVRQTLGIGFDGFTYPEAYLCYSTLFPLEERLTGLCHVNYISDPDEWLVLLRAPSAWRVLLSVEDPDDHAESLTDDYARSVFRRLLGSDEPVEIVHRTVYRIHQRVAERFTQGRICLAGDAAHVNSPIGGYGMNSGIHDVFNLTEKLVAILRDGSDIDLLGQYDRQRRTIAQAFVQAQTMDNTRAMKEGWSQRRANMARASMAELVADPVKRYELLCRQSMLQSIEDARAIA